MLLLAAAWIALLAAATAAGLGIVHLARGGSAFDRLGDRLVAAAWVGLIVIGVVLQGASLVVALSPATGGIVALAGLAGALAMPAVRRDLVALARRLNPALVAGGLVLLAGVAAYMAQRVVWTDTGLYHASAIRWLSEEGAVRGLAHIHSRFGYSSLWFDLSAPFNDGDLRERLVAVVSGFALLLAGAQLALVGIRALSGRARHYDWLALVALGVAVPVSLSWRQPVAPNPDFPLILLPIVVAWAMAVARTRDGRTARRTPAVIDARLIPLLIASGAMAVKVNGAALVLVAALFYVWPPGLRVNRVAVAAVAIVVVTAPSLLTGYVVSGCPVYPAPPCFDKPWGVGAASAHGEAVAIRSYARRRAAVPGERFASTDWIGPWLRRSANLFLLGSLVLGGVAAWRAPPSVRWSLAVGFTGAALVLYSAPDLRFALGYSAVLLGAFWVRWGGAILGLVPRAGALRLRAGTSVAVALLVVGGVFVAARLLRPTVDGDRSLALVQPPMLVEPLLTRLAVGNVHYFVPADGELCWASPVPCTDPSLVRSDTTLRDPGVGLAAGFEH